MARPLKSSEQTLEKQKIVTTAIELMNSVGIEGVTIRRLAEALNVKGPALYWHVKSKEELLGLMCEDVLASCAAAVTQYDTWQDWILQVAIETRRQLRGLRDGGQLIALARWTDTTKIEQAEMFRKPIVDAGLPLAGATNIQVASISYVLGWIIIEEQMDRRDLMAQSFDTETAFVNGMKAMLAGFELKHAQNPDALKD
jgi:TetR/AcrR family tetracycline transcriptional repressor